MKIDRIGKRQRNNTTSIGHFIVVTLNFVLKVFNSHELETI